MKTPSKLLTLGITAIVAGALGWNAFAESRIPSSGPPMHAVGTAGTGPKVTGCTSANLAGTLTSIKQQLRITTAEEPAWDAYATSARDAAASRWTAHHDTAMNAMRDGSAMGAVMNKMRDQQGQTLRALRAAAEKLTVALDDTQKQKAREVLPGLATGSYAMLGMGMMMDMTAME